MFYINSRQDEIGTPFRILGNSMTLETGTVTLENRDATIKVSTHRHTTHTQTHHTHTQHAHTLIVTIPSCHTLTTHTTLCTHYTTYTPPHTPHAHTCIHHTLLRCCPPTPKLMHVWSWEQQLDQLEFSAH